LLKGGHTEVSIFVHDPRYGVLRKCRVDLLVQFSGSVFADFDFKTIGDIDRFWWDAHKMHWLEQRAYYADTVQMLTGCQCDSALVAIEDDPPHCRTIFPIDKPHLDRARATVDGWLTQYTKCMETGIWDDYPLYSEFRKPGYRED